MIDDGGPLTLAYVLSALLFVVGLIAVLYVMAMLPDWIRRVHVAHLRGLERVRRGTR